MTDFHEKQSNLSFCHTIFLKRKVYTARILYDRFVEILIEKKFQQLEDRKLE